MVSPGCHIRFTKYAFTAGERRMAAGMPSTSRFGITLVNSEPGPSVIRSASRDRGQRGRQRRRFARTQADRADAVGGCG